MAEQEKSKKRLVSEFQKRKNSYLASYKKIKRLVENAAGQKSIDDPTKDRFRVAALDSNKSHKELREFLLPFFSDAGIREVFPEEAYAEENDNLKGIVQELQRNKQVLDALVEELSEKCHSQNEKLLETEKLQETVSKLRNELEKCRSENVELKMAIDDEDALKQVRRGSNRNEQQDMLIRDLEHRLSFRHKGHENGSRRDRLIEHSLEKVYKINGELEEIGASVTHSPINTESSYLHIREVLIKTIIKLDDIASGGSAVVRTERALVVKKAQALLELLDSKRP